MNELAHRLLGMLGGQAAANPQVQQFARLLEISASEALAIPDAEQLERMLARGRPVTIRLLLTPKKLGAGQSGCLRTTGRAR